jgi:RNA polymerase sigma-70 factor (ECF subfamily)
LFKQLSRRQREQFETQALVHLDALLRAAARLCNSREEAEDAVQQTYLQAWKYWSTFQQGTNCRSWLFRILFNVIKKGCSAHQALSVDESTAANILRFTPNQQIQAYEVMEAFDHLEQEHRAVLLLIAVEEMSYKEAAFVLSVPVGTVMSRLNRARTQLRRLLERGHGHSQAEAIKR